MDSESFTKGALSSLPALLVASLIVYGLGLGVYRLYLHPLTKFPGPKLAAVTSFYEGYYEIVQKGQYSMHISKLHDQYGKILSFPPHPDHLLRSNMLGAECCSALFAVSLIRDHR